MSDADSGERAPVLARPTVVVLLAGVAGTAGLYLFGPDVWFKDVVLLGAVAATAVVAAVAETLAQR